MPQPLAGRYVLMRQIGAGRHARVFEASDLKLGRPVAVKLVAPNGAADAAQRLDVEGRIAGALAHPNVYAVTDRGTTEQGLPFLVLELLSGETLATRLGREGALPIEHALAIAEQMLAGLAAAHVRGIVHRDVKPGNVFLVTAGADQTLAKIIDFGIAQLPEALRPEDMPVTDTGFVIGTPEYMSPEQVSGARDFDPRTDVYAAGIVLYEMLSGVRPFADRPPAKMLEAIAFETIPPIATRVPHLPAAVARAIDAAVARDRDRRHADADAFLLALRSKAAAPATSVTHVLAENERASGDDSDQDWDLSTEHAASPPSPYGRSRGPR